MVYETYSKRKKRIEQSGQEDVYQHGVLPQPFRTQVQYIWRQAIGRYYHSGGTYPEMSRSNGVWNEIRLTLAEERGVERIAGGKNAQQECEQYLATADIDGALDIIELSFRTIKKWQPTLWNYTKETGVTLRVTPAIEKLNIRFREHGIGYQFVDDQIMRVDSEYVHAEVVVPALTLLRGKGFEGAEAEFRQAHEHYRSGDNVAAINEASKAFESTMKAICTARDWPLPDKLTAAPLIETLLKQGLIPKELTTQFQSLQSVLSSGVPTIRNQAGRGHGQGAALIPVPDFIAAFALHLTAANIVFLVEAHRLKDHT